MKIASLDDPDCIDLIVREVCGGGGVQDAFKRTEPKLEMKPLAKALSEDDVPDDERLRVHGSPLREKIQDPAYNRDASFYRKHRHLRA